MTTYKIIATKETQYEFEIEADSEGEAIDKMGDIETQGDADNYAIDWYPLEVSTIEEVEENN